MATPTVNQRHRNTCLVDMIFGSHFYEFLTKIIGYFFVFAFAWGVFMGIWAIIMRNHVESGQVQLFSFNYKMRFNGSLDTATDLALIDQYTELAHLLFMRGSKSKNDTEKKKIPEEKTPEDKYRNLQQLVKKRQKIRARNEDKKEAETCKAGVTHKEASSDDGYKTTGVVNGKTGTVKLADFGFAVYKEPSNVTAIKSWCRQILSALEYLHNRTPMIIHRDVKGDSILIDGVSGKIKLADFCIAVPYEGSVDNVAGTLAYLSAEDLEGEQNEKSDIYSFGMCVLQMMTTEAVYSEYRSEYELFAKIKSGVKPVALYLVQDRMVRKFIEKCLAKASKRPTVSALLKHPFIEKVQSCTFPELVYDLQLRQFIERCVKPLYERPAASEFLKHPCLSTNGEGGERSQDNRPNPSRLGSLRKLSSTRKSRP